MTAILWIDKPGASVEQLGGKVNSLAEMTAAGFTVPPGFGVTTDAFRDFAAGADLPERIAEIRGKLDAEDLAAVSEASGAIAALIDTAPMPDAIEREIRSAYAVLEERAGEAVPVAVRSSGVNEDLEGASFAGQYDTYLWICGADEVLRHVRRCWAGLFNSSLLTYRPENGVAPGGDELPGMGVGVQQMARSRSAGVMFTLDPVSGDRSKILIESCWGLGEGVVKGDVTPDRYRIDKVTLEVLESTVNEQSHEYRFDREGGAVDLMPIEEERQGSSSLPEEEALKVAELGKRVERHRGSPQDIEWAIDADGTLHLLQARPETVWASRHARGVDGGEAKGGAVDRVLASFLSAKGRGDR
jgi:pyruvate,water dikinase